VLLLLLLLLLPQLLPLPPMHDLYTATLNIAVDTVNIGFV
jgi:hypothetical protein